MKYLETKFRVAASGVEISGQVSQCPAPLEELPERPMAVEKYKSFRITAIVDASTQEEIDVFAKVMNDRRWEQRAPDQSLDEGDDTWVFTHLRHRAQWIWKVTSAACAFLVVAEITSVLDSYEAPDL